MRAYFDVRSIAEVFGGTHGLTLKITQTSIYYEYVLARDDEDKDYIYMSGWI